MTTLKVGIASYEEMKARTMAVTRGERRVKADEPKVWFTSRESFAKILSAGNRELLRVIAEKAPGSLDEWRGSRARPNPICRAHCER
jgi:predicted transcriptional regulator